MAGTAPSPTARPRHRWLGAVIPGAVAAALLGTGLVLLVSGAVRRHRDLQRVWALWSGTALLLAGAAVVLVLILSAVVRGVPPSLVEWLVGIGALIGGLVAVAVLLAAADALSSDRTGPPPGPPPTTTPTTIAPPAPTVPDLPPDG